MDNLLMLIFAVAALLGSALMQVILAVAGYRSRSERRERDSMLRTLQEEVLVLSSDIAASSRRIGQLERQLAGAASTYHEKPLISGPVGQAYEVAVNLVRKGADVDDIVETCGLSHGEAELIAGLYRAPAKGTTASATSQSSAREREVTARTGVSAYEAAY